MNYESKIDETAHRSAVPGGIEVAPYSDYDAVPKRRWTTFVALGLIALIMIGAWYMFMRADDSATTAGKGGAAAQAEGEKDVPTVSVAVPARQTVERIINASGTLGARREVPIGVVGEGGRVIDVRTDAGGWVSQGQVLVVVERSVQNEQVRALQASISARQSDARLAQAELDRAQSLVARGFISKADIDRKMAARDAANAQVRVAQAQLSEMQARNARLDIRAPASGYILSRDVEIGQVISAGSPALFTMARSGEIELNAQLNEADLAAVSTGTRATVTPVGTTQEFSGQIWQISPMIDATTRQGIARIALPFDRGLRPGGFANAQIVAGSVEAPVLPESAVMSDDEGNYVLVVGKDNKLEKRRVTTGVVGNQGIAINQGLSGTEQVVLRAGGFVNEGDLVKPKMVVLNGVKTEAAAASTAPTSAAPKAAAPAQKK